MVQGAITAEGMLTPRHTDSEAAPRGQRMAGVLQMLSEARQRIGIREIVRSRATRAATVAALLVSTACSAEPSVGEFREGGFRSAPPVASASATPGPEVIVVPELMTPDNVCDVLPLNNFLQLAQMGPDDMAQKVCTSDQAHGVFTEVTYYRHDGVTIRAAALDDAVVAQQTSINNTQMSGMGSFEQYVSFGRKHVDRVIGTDNKEYPIAWDDHSARVVGGAYSLHVQLDTDPTNAQRGYTPGAAPTMDRDRLFAFLREGAPAVLGQSVR